MQRGRIEKHNGAWRLRYYDEQYRDGKLVTVHVSKTLARVSKEYPTVASVRTLADKILAPLNHRQLQPESSMLLTDFIENKYFPRMEKELRPSTIHNYRVSIYDKHLKDKLGNLTVRDFRTVHAQKLFRSIEGVHHTTLLHIKNFLSGVFKFALREGVIDGINPIQNSSVPGKVSKFKGAAYTLDQVFIMMAALAFADHKEPTASEVITLFSLTGLRQSECRGLRWSDWNEETGTLRIQRSVWGVSIGPTKNPASDGEIPVLPILAQLLAGRRERVKPEPDDYIFAGERRGQPLDFHNLVNRQIKPSLKNVDGVKWEGFHGFRRGLASNLFAVGVNPKVIAAMLRHQSMAITLQHYIKTPDDEMRKAKEKLGNWTKLSVDQQ
jgi:integrase